MTETVTETKPDTTGTTGPLRRHVVPRVPPHGHLADKALCGVSWDRAHPLAGDLCESCVAEYRRIRPGWPLPGGGA